MKSFTTLIVSLLAIVPYTFAHGFVDQVTIDGKVYKGNTPNDPKCEFFSIDLYGSFADGNFSCEPH